MPEQRTLTNDNKLQSTGIVHLGDLAEHYTWNEPRLARYLEWLGLKAGQVQTHSICPPEHLIVICHCKQLQLLEQFRLWMSIAARLYVYISFEDSPELWDDMEIRRRTTNEAAKIVRSLNLRGLRHFSTQFTTTEALEIVAVLFGKSDYTPEQKAGLTFPVRPQSPSETSPSAAGPWCRLPKHSYLEHDEVWPRLACVNEGRPSLWLPSQSQFLRLDDGSLAPTLARDDSSAPGVVNLANGEVFKGGQSTGAIIGLWPSEPVQLGWSGGRCVFDWLLISSGQAGHLSACEHEWPCGHAKKQYGFLDNEPCWIQLSSEADCYLSVYQKDAIINDEVPIRWTSYGNTWAACPRQTSKNRALFFCHDESDSWDGNPLDPDDSDARMLRPAIVLGPNPALRYALDLSRPVYRIQGNTSQLVSGAATRAPQSSKTGHFGVYSADHQLRRLGSGRLLGGWDRWLTTLKSGRLQREEIDSGKSVDRGIEDREISWAFSLPGTTNLILVHQQDEEIEVRLI